MASIADTQTTAAKGLSLHVGLNEIDPNHYDGSHGYLSSCINDANAMADLARSQGFDVLGVLTNQAGTRQAVKSAFMDAAARLKAGDVFLFTYSGHGSNVMDENADELQDAEPDRLDETWCLYDGMLVDDEVYKMWQSFAEGVRVLVLLDCCHSGSGIKAPGTAPGKKLPGLPRALSKSQAVKTFVKNRALYAAIQAEAKGSRDLPVLCAVNLISACRDDQTASDGEPDGYGFFTEQVLSVWDNGGFQGSLTDFHQKVRDLAIMYQEPKFYPTGKPDPAFDAKRPFSI